MSAASRCASILLLVILGCDLGPPARFVAPSDEGKELQSQDGVLWTIPGNEVLANGEMGPTETLLCFLVANPRVTAIARGTGTTHGREENTYSTLWQTPAENIKVDVRWSKQRDTVTIGKQHFNRAEGKVFVVIRQPNGALFATQLSNSAPVLTAVEAFKFIQESLPAEPFIATNRLAE